MKQLLRILGLPVVAGGLVVGLGLQSPVAGQEVLPNPRLLQARAARLDNGGIELEWDYHRRANMPGYEVAKITPISKFAGGSGYCTPVLAPRYYGCDRRGCR